MIAAKQMKVGMVVERDGGLFRVMSVTHITPGNWRGMVQVKLRNLSSGNQEEKRFGSDDPIERAVLQQNDMEYLYNEGDFYTFMNSETYEQMSLTKEDLGAAVGFLLPNTKVVVETHDGRALGVALPSTVTLAITEAEPGIKNATATGSYKQAKVETGLTVKVPNFINVGDKIKVNTDTCEYVERA